MTDHPKGTVIDRHCIHCGRPVVYEPVNHLWIHAGDSTFLADPRCRKNTRQPTVAEPLRRAADPADGDPS